jgi:hypothetical protein
MPDTMIEKVCRALCVAVGDAPDERVQKPRGLQTSVGEMLAELPTMARWEGYSETARAVLTALGEPDAATLKAGAEADAEGSETNARDVWQAMLGAMLGDKADG